MTSQMTPAGFRPGEAGEVDGGLGLADALQHAARAALERKDVARLDEVAGRALGVDGDLDRARPIVRGDAGGDALAGLDRDGERGLERRFVLRRHEVEAELVAALRRERQADQAAPVRGHEVHGLGRRELRRHRQVALVLAILVVADDDHLALADVLQGLVDRGERGAGLRAHATKLAKRASRAARSGVRRPRRISAAGASRRTSPRRRPRGSAASRPPRRPASCAPASRG